MKNDAPVRTMAETFQEDMDQITELARFTRQECLKAMEGRPTNAFMVGAIYGGQMALMENMMAEASKHWVPRAQCQDNCSVCCYQEVIVSTVELANIAIRLPQEYWAGIVERADRATQYGKDERFIKAIPCPMLEKKRCGIYEIRPQACRTHFSVNRAACLREWRLRHTSREHKVPMVGRTKSLGFAMMVGIDAAMLSRGLEVELIEFSQGLKVMLRAGAVEKWLAGERLFTEVAKLSNNGDSYIDIIEQIMKEP